MDQKTSKKIKEERIYGESAVRALFKHRKKDIIRLFVREGEQGRFKEILSDFAKEKKLYRLVPNIELDKISESTHHEGVCAIASPKPYVEITTLISRYKKNFKGDPLVILDNLGNPHNVGGIIRSAAFFGYTSLIINSKTKLALSGALTRTSEGGVEHCSITHTRDASDLLLALRQNHIPVLVTDANAENDALDEKYLKKPYALVLGNESSGVSKQILEASSVRFKVSGKNLVQSLNVSVCAGVVFNNLFNFSN